MNLRTVYAPAKLVGEELGHAYDWTPHLVSPQPDTLTAAEATYELEKFDGETPDVTVSGIQTTGTVMKFTVGEGGPVGFNLGIIFTRMTTGGQRVQVRIVVPIRSR